MKRKIYNDKSEKVIDFLIGALAIPVLLGISTNWLFDISENRILFIVEAIAAIYFSIMRKYIGIGLLFTVVVIPLIILGSCFLIFNSGRLF